MRIGLVIYGSLDTLSGGYLYDRKLVEYLRSQGDTVEIISLPWRSYAAHLTDNLWFRLWSQGACSRPSRRPTAALPHFDILIEDELNHPSLIAANQGIHPYPIISLVHHLRCSERRPSWQNAFYRWIEKKYLQSVDGLIFNSKTTERTVNELVGNGKPGIIAYPPTDRFSPPISEAEIIQRSQTTPLRILFLGNLIERKGLDTLLNALLILNTKSSSFILDIVGSLTSDPKYSKHIQEFILRNALSSSVFLHGPLDNQPLSGTLRRAHVLVVPSSYEGFGIVYLEGMCFGLPAIGTTAGAAPEVIADGETGYLIEPGDAASLAAHLRSLAEDRALLARLSLGARQRYLRQPAWTETAASIRSFLEAISKWNRMG